MPCALRRLHDARELERLAFADHRRDRVVAEQDLVRRDAAAADLRAEDLRDDALQRLAQHDADLRLPIRRELIDDAVDRADRRRRVERAEDEVAGLRRLDRDRDRLEVAHLADEDDVRILAQRRAERVLEALRVLADLALIHEALLVLVHELDRVLDRDDVIGAVLVDEVDHRRERRRLARARRARSRGRGPSRASTGRGTPSAARASRR